MQVGVLGPLEVSVGDLALDAGPPKQQCVLAVLALEANRVVGVNALLDRLWEEDPPEQARNVVQTYVARWRRTFSRAGLDGARLLRFGSGGYRLAVEREQVDLFRLRALEEQAQREPDPHRAAELLRDAVGLWRGTPLSGIEGGWAERTRHALEQQLLATRRRLVEVELGLGRHADLVAELSELAAAFPLDEALAGLWMRALYGSGRQAEALGVFRALRERLVDEVGDEPGPELQRLHEQVLRRAPELAGSAPPVAVRPSWVARDDLPAEPGDFTGRAGELSRITAAARSGGERVTVLAVDGMAGAGKTALALRAARLLTPECPDGRLFLDLFGHTPGVEPLPPADALDTLLRAAGASADQIPDGTPARAAAWRARLAGKRVLLVLDNAATADQVRPLLPGAPGCVVLVTSRTRLAGLAEAQALSLPTLPPAEAVDLFGRVAGPAAAADPGTVSEVVGLCGHLPLAVTLAAARLRHRPTWTVADLRDRLRDQARRLGELRAGDRALAPAFETSYRALPDPLRRTFRLLGLLPGPDVDADAVAALAGLPTVEVELEQLLDVHLLEEPAAGRYRLHDLLRRFAIDTLARDEPAADRERAADRLLDHYAERAEAASSDYGAASAGWLDRSLPDLLAAVVDAERRGRDEHVGRIAAALFEHLENRSRYAEGERLFDAAVRAARRRGDRAAEAVALRGLGVMLWRRGRFQAAQERLEAALDASRAAGDPGSEAMALYHLGGLAVQAARPGDAVWRYRTTLRLQRDLGDDRRLGNTLNNLGVAHAASGDHEAAARCLREALELRRRVGDVRGELATLSNLADARLAGGDPEAAREELLAVVALARRVGDTRAEAAAHVDLGAVALAAGDADAAPEHFGYGLALTRTLGDPLEEIAALMGIGYARLDAGQPESAAPEFDAALRLAEGIGARYEAAHAAASLAQALVALGRREDAVELARAALRAFEALGSPQAADVARWLTES